MERKIGEFFNVKGKRYRVELNKMEGCRDCAFCSDEFAEVACRSVLTCDKEYRADGQNVVAVGCYPPSAYQPTDEVIECTVPDSRDCNNRYNGACLGDEECLEVDRPGLTLPEEPPMPGNLAAEHWEYVKATLQIHGVSDQDLLVIGHHYRMAFLHGFKHGAENV